MLPPHKFIDELIASLRNVIAPAIVDPYPKAQAYMAAVLLELIARQVEERTDSTAAKQQELATLFHDVGQNLADQGFPQLISEALDGEPDSGTPPGTISDPTLEASLQEKQLCRLIETLYTHKEEIGSQLFARLNHRVRSSLRSLLDEDLKAVRRPVAKR